MNKEELIKEFDECLNNIACGSNGLEEHLLELAKSCADIAITHAEKKSVGFAQWLQGNRWFNFDKQAQKWCYTFEMGTSIPRKTYEKDFMKTSEELYKEFLKQK